MFVSFLIMTIPNFLLVFLIKCVDQYAYKKKGITESDFGWVLSNVIVVLLSHVLFAALDDSILMIHPAASLYAPIVLVPIFTVAALLTMYLYERKAFKHTVYPSMPSKSFGINVGLSMIFNAAYCALICWNVFPIEIEILSEADPNPKQEMKDVVLWIGVVSLVVILTLIKIACQPLIARSKKKSSETE